MATTQEAIETAKKFLADDKPHIAVFCLRDLPIIDELGLHESVWTMCRDDAYVNASDVEFLIEQITMAES